MSNEKDTSPKTKFQAFLNEELSKVQGIYYPVKAGFLRRVLVKNISIKKLHPNPDDEFCKPDIGPNYSIISRYQGDLARLKSNSNAKFLSHNAAYEPLQVQKISPDGYMILNGHHRWAAARQVGLRRIDIEIMDLTQKEDILKMIKASGHDRRVTLDLDEVVFCPDDSALCEKPLPLWLRRTYKERIRLGIPALFQFLAGRGYDIWVYTARYYSTGYLRYLFRHYRCPVAGIITGTGRKGPSGSDMRQQLEEIFDEKYQSTLHIDNTMVLQTFAHSRTFRDYQLEHTDSRWSAEVMNIIQEIEAKEQKK